MAGQVGEQREHRERRHSRNSSGVNCFGGLYTFNSGTLDTPIPDGNPNGIQSTIAVSGLSVIQDVNVYLNVSGGYDGDLYASLNLGGQSGTTVVLLNRIGATDLNPFGSAAAGLGDGSSTYDNGGTWYSFQLDDAAATSSDSYTGGSGTYQPSGSLSYFNGQSANGDWTIFFADMASEGGTGPSTLNSWGLEIQAVPEPVNVAWGCSPASCWPVRPGESFGPMRKPEAERGKPPR